MFLSIFRFEIAYHLRRPLLYMVAFFFGLLAWGATVSDVVQVGGSIGNIHRNAPLVIVRMLAFFTPISTFVITAFVASAALRDFELGSHPLFFSKPVKKFDYLMGRFAGTLVISCLVFVGPALGILLGSFMPWIDPARLGATTLAPYFAGLFYFVFPSMLFMGALFFVVASLSRSWLYTYLGVILFFVGFFLSRDLRRDIENETVAALLDPFGLGALNLQTRYWTIVESNTLVPELSGPLLYNRLLWLGLGLAVLAIGYVTFSYSRSVSIARKKQKKLEEVPEERPTSAGQLPVMKPDFGPRTTWRQTVKATGYETWEVLRSIPFLVILAFGLFNLIASSDLQDRMFGTSVQPVTHLMWTGIQQSYSFLLIIIITFYAGELVWRERGRDLKDVFDATPAKNVVFLVSKLAALFAVVLTFLLTGILASIGVQLYRGYTNFEFDVYALGLLVNGYPFLLIAVLAVALQVLSNNKFLGFLLMIGYMLSGIALNALDYTHNLYNYAGTPGAPFSDMNRYGHFFRGLGWFHLYWTLFALFLAVVAAVFWVRGREGAWRFRTRLARRRLRGATGILAAASVVGFAAVGAWIFYNTNVLNDYVPPDVQEEIQAEYEKKYRQYMGLPMPKIVAVDTRVDIFPYERRIEAEGTYSMVNRTDKPIDALHLNLSTSPAVTFHELRLPEHTVELADEKLGYYIYSLKTPLGPGESMDLFFDLTVEPKGFVNSGSDTNLVYNGTFFNNRNYFPLMGYNPNFQLVDRNDRRKHDLEPVLRMPEVDDLEARQNTYLGADADWIDFKTTVSTAADQIVIAPGYLQEERIEGDRRYFTYEMDAPILHFYSYLSARYEVLRDRWNDVDIEIYYHPGHEYNLDRMVEAIKDSLDYFSENFSPYQHRQVRIIEFPRYQRFAQAFPNTIPFSESIGFIARLDDDPDAVDYVYYVTAHEVAHQWWAHQVIGGNVQGATMLSETMAQYSALMVMEQEYGREKMQRFLKFELDRYLRSRGGELVEEMPLMLVENQQYIHYRKGSVVMYALRDLLGEETLNRAIAAYVDEVAFQEPPFTHTPEFMAHIYGVTPAEHVEAVRDLFERITLFDHEVKKATYREQDDGTYRVRLETASTKLYADGQGTETEAPLDEWVDIGIFGDGAGSGDGEESEDKVLFFEKRRIDESSDGVFEVVVDEKPVRAGIDPYHKVVDRNTDNNVRSVRPADEAADD